MPHIILITGPSDFIAAHIIRYFLEVGYHVRATVSSESEYERVQAAFVKYVGALSLLLIRDYSALGAFDAAVQGVDGIIHTASPVTSPGYNYETEAIEVAIAGSLSVMRAAKAYGSTIKRIVITPLFAVNSDFQINVDPGSTYTEDDWNLTMAEARSNPPAAYLASKNLAEKAVFEFVDTEEPSFTVATLSPPIVFGTPANDLATGKLDNTSTDIYNLVSVDAEETPPASFYTYLDVRDLAKAHLLAYQTVPAANQRYLVVSGSHTFQLFVNLARKHCPELIDSMKTRRLSDTHTSDVYRTDEIGQNNDLTVQHTPEDGTVVEKSQASGIREKVRLTSAV